MKSFPTKTTNKYHLIGNVLMIVFSCIFFVNLMHTDLFGQSIKVGEGSYTIQLPSGQSSASNKYGERVLPNVGGNFNKLHFMPGYVPVTTNNFWSNLIFRYAPDEPSYIHAHPLQLKAEKNGLTLGYANSSSNLLTGSNFIDDYTYFTEGELKVSLLDVVSSNFKVVNYTDWTATSSWTTDSTNLEATFGHGLPYVFFKINGAKVQLSSEKTSAIWHHDNNVLGITIDGKHFGIFAPTGSSWNSSFPLISDLNGKDFLSIAILPDTSQLTFDLFKTHAYAFVEDTKAHWSFNPKNNLVQIDYEVTTTLMENNESYSNSTLQALYRHQWLNTSDEFTNLNYQSPRGEMKVIEANNFTTNNSFIGILPFLPDLGNYDRAELNQYLIEVANQPIVTSNDSYNSGKEMGKYAQLVHIADQLGNLRAKNTLLYQLKLALENWLTAGGNQQYYYDQDWKVLIGFPASHGSNLRLNDQHFHHGYTIFAAATVAKFDSKWATNENWGGMINLLIKNASNWDRKDHKFPYLRNFDIYAGHSWASGDGSWFVGNNQESSSESINYAASIFLWGEITGQDNIRDLGAYLYTIESEAINQYWFDVDEEVFPEEFEQTAAGMVTGSGAIHGTWFSSDVEKIHGINFLPITAGSMYLGTNPDYVKKNYNSIVEKRGSEPISWKDILWSYLAFYDAELALSHFDNDKDYQVFDGETKARTMHWLHNLKVLGQVNSEVQADIASYNVFVNSNNDTTYVAYNSDPFTKKVTFTNGFSFDVQGNELKASNKSMLKDTVGKPLTKPEFPSLNVISAFSEFYESSTSLHIKPDTEQSTKAKFTTIDHNNVLVLESLESQVLNFDTKLDISTRTHFYSNIWSNTNQSLTISLTQGDNISKSIAVNLLEDRWLESSIELTLFEHTIDLKQVDGIIIHGANTIVLDDFLFYGDTPVKAGPDSSAILDAFLSENVKSIFSNHFDPFVESNFEQNSEYNTVFDYYILESDSILKLKNLDSYYIELGNDLDVTNMVNFHFHYWTQETNDLTVNLISSDGKESSYVINVLKHSWQEVEIDLRTHFGGIDLSKISGIKFTGDETLFLDNILFFKYPELIESPLPEHPSDHVISLFSDHYTEYRNAYPMYGQMNETIFSAEHDAATVEITDLNGNNMLYYKNSRYALPEFFQGIGPDGKKDNGIDGTKVTNVRFDFYTKDKTDSPTKLEFKLVDFGGDAYGGGNDTEGTWLFEQDSNPKLESHKWISVDIPLEDLPGMTRRKNLSQMVFIVTGDLQYYYIDNLYFYSDQAINSNQDSNSEFPKQLNLYQNYPNPFNPNTNIQFELPFAGNTSLKIYNSLGQLVQTLVDNYLSEGRHNYSFDANQLSSGIYFYQLQFGNKSITNKMMLLK